MIGYSADCLSESWVWAIYGGPYAFAADRSFGDPAPRQYIASVLDFNPGTVMLNGRLIDDANASGIFSLAVLWDRSDPCTTGEQPWSAVQG